MKKIISGGEIFLSVLRDKNSSIKKFRRTSHKLGRMLAYHVAAMLEKETYSLETPLGATDGFRYKNNVILVPILRSGIALLSPFLEIFECSRVGFVGMQRDEKTAIAELYYEKLPPIEKEDTIVLLDPMIATGGSAIDTLKILLERGAREEQIIFVAVVAAPEGLEKIETMFPKIQIIIPIVDEKLNNKKFIVPGLGDYGDRFFGTPEPEL